MAIVLGLIAGIVIGYYLTTQMSSGNATQLKKIKSQLDEVLNENEKLRSRAKTAERQVEDLTAENKKIRSKSREEDDDRADLEDEVSSLKSKLRKAMSENETLSRNLKEAKEAYTTLESQYNKLK